MDSAAAGVGGPGGAGARLVGGAVAACAGPLARYSPIGWAVVRGDVTRPAVLKGVSAAVVCADPPYNQGIDYGGGRTRDSLPADEYLAFTRDWCRNAVARLAPGGAAWVVISDEWAAEIVYQLKHREGLELRNWVKWHETFGTYQKQKFGRCSRHVLYFVKPGGRPHWSPDRVPSARQEKYQDARADPRGKIPEDVWQISRVAGTFEERAYFPDGRVVPTQIPEALWRRALRATAPPGSLVLEFFAGSGSAGRVALGEGLLYEGWESDPQTAELCAARVGEVAADPGTPEPRAG